MTTQTADLCDAHPEVEVLELPLLDFGGLRAFHGAASTLEVFEDNTLVRTALEAHGQGRVLVVDGGGSRRCALLGDQLAKLAVENGWAGVVVHGCVRDAEELSRLPLGIKALGCCPRKSEKRGEGRSQLPVRFGGVTIAPGAYVYADADGILVAQGPLPLASARPG